MYDNNDGMVKDIVAGIGGNPSPAPGGENEEADPEMVAAEELLGAFQSGDAAAVRDAMRSIYELMRE